MKTILIGAGSDLGIHIDGAKEGPKRLLTDLANFYNGEQVLIEQDRAIIKSRSLADKRKNQVELQKFNTTLYNLELEHFNQDYFPITIGGDHSITIATTLADIKKHENIGMICITPKSRYNTFETTATGNIHDLSIAAINGYKCNELKNFHTGNIVASKNTVIIGIDTLTRQERDNIKYAGGATVFTIEQIKKQEIEPMIEQAFLIACEKTNKVHISFDLGIFSSNISIGVSIPEENGITEEEGMAILNAILKHIDKISAFDLVEFNPKRDNNRKTEQLAVNILAKTIMTAQRN